MNTPLDAAQQRFLASLPAGEEGAAYPVEQWNPGHCGHSHMRIDSEGRWHHEGAPIPRPALIGLFARLLRAEPDGSHVLVTPAEKLTIDVDDAPLIATGLRTEGEGETRQIALLVEHFGWIIAGPDHPLSVIDGASGPRPMVRGPRGLRARIARPVYYDLVELALAEHGTDAAGPIGLWSGGMFHALDGASAGQA